jgi:hypothetical protein
MAMTWGQLAERIASMSDEDKGKTVTFLEPYDDPAIHYVELVVTEDELIDDDGNVIVDDGEYYLGA